MGAHWKYLLYVCKHKWFVFLACIRLGVSLRQAITHDWSKFLPSEWFAYVHFFYTEHKDKAAFDIAWNHHQKAQPHHWQYWLLITDSDDPRLRALPMPRKYVLEMLADWSGAGRAINGKSDVRGWYEKMKDKIILEDETRKCVETILATMPL